MFSSSIFLLILFADIKTCNFFSLTGKKLSAGKGIGGKGRLTITRINTLENFYGLAIRNNKGNSEAMSKVTMAILDHYKEDTLHEHCPPGKGSWFSFQRNVATESSFHKPIKTHCKTPW